MNPADLRMRLELAARSKPVLKKLLSGKLEREDLGPIADVAAELGAFELSFALRDLARNPTMDGAKRLAACVSGMREDELERQLGEWSDDARDLTELARIIGAVFK